MIEVIYDKQTGQIFGYNNIINKWNQSQIFVDDEIEKSIITKQITNIRDIPNLDFSEERPCIKLEEPSINYPYFVSVVSVIRNENKYLEEWIRYHIEEMGIDHFYIYDNESKVSILKYLQKRNFSYLDRLTILDFPTTEWVQQDSHNHFLEHFRNETKWVISMDPDEYIVLKDNRLSLKNFLNENKKYAKIFCPWKFFNANGRVHESNGTDFERFQTATEYRKESSDAKAFTQTYFISEFRSHTACVDLNMPIATSKNHPEITKDAMQLNHYYTRSYDEWVEKIKRGSCHPSCLKKYSEFFLLNPDMKEMDLGLDIVQRYCPEPQSYK